MEELIAMLNSIQPLSPSLETHLRSRIRRCIFKKGDYLLQVGEVSRAIWYLRTGLVRSYCQVHGHEKSNWFMKEGDIAISILSFFSQEPSVDSIVALENCECWGFAYDDLQGCYTRHPEFNLHGRVLTEEYYQRSERRNQSVLRQTPEDRYSWMMEHEPELIRRLTNNHLASYLNVSTRTLNTIKKDFAEGTKKVG